MFKNILLKKDSSTIAKNKSIMVLEMYIDSKHIKIIGYSCITIGLIAWLVELLGMVYVCPYCRVQRTIIAIVGLFMISPWVAHWVCKYITTVFVGFGFVVAVSQHFMGWKKISSGDFIWESNLLINPMILSGIAMFILVAQISLIFNYGRKI